MFPGTVAMFLGRTDRGPSPPAGDGLGRGPRVRLPDTGVLVTLAHTLAGKTHPEASGRSAVVVPRVVLVHRS